MSLSVKYIDVPVGAQEAALVSSDSAQPFGTADQLITGATDIPYATLEPGSWSLDGTRELLQDNASSIGWWSKERTEDDRRFVNPPVITISFPEPYTSTGMTFIFWPSMDHWCSEIYVSWYNGNTLLLDSVFYPDGAKWILNQAVESFDKITIELRETNKHGEFAKIQQIQIGHVVIFLQDEIVKVSLLNEVDHSLCELSADTMKIELRDKRNRSLLPQKNQEMQLFRNDEQIASQFISNSSREEQHYYTFHCQSAIGLLEDDFMGGIYNAYPVEAILADVMEEVSYLTDESFSGQTVTGYLPVCTRREALQQIAFAIGAVVSTQGDGVVRLSPLNMGIMSELTEANIFAGAKVTRHAQTAAVQIYSHSYAAGTEAETLIDNETITGSNNVFVFLEPHHSYVITGGTIEDSGVNWVKITANGKVTLTGQKYIHSTSVRTQKNPLATAAEKSNVITVDNATLIHSGNVQNVLNRMYDAQKLKYQLQENVVVFGQKAGHVVSSVNPWDTKTVGYITSMENEFTNSGHTANITIQGVEDNLYDGKTVFSE